MGLLTCLREVGGIPGSDRVVCVVQRRFPGMW